MDFTFWLKTCNLFDITTSLQNSQDLLCVCSLLFQLVFELSFLISVNLIKENATVMVGVTKSHTSKKFIEEALLFVENSFKRSFLLWHFYYYEKRKTMHQENYFEQKINKATD